RRNGKVQGPVRTTAEDHAAGSQTDAAILRAGDRGHVELCVLIVRAAGTRIAHINNSSRASIWSGIVRRSSEVHILAIALVRVGEIVSAVRLVVCLGRRAVCLSRSRLVRGAGGEHA